MKHVLFLFAFFCLAAGAVAEDAVKLPAFDIQPKWDQWFPADKPFFAEKYPEGSLQGLHLRYLSRLEGPSVTLHDNGKLKSLSYYPGGVRQGAYRLWDDDGKMTFFGQFKDGKRQGVLCLFKAESPWLVQHWDAGKLENETLVKRDGDSFTPTTDAAQLDTAKEQLTAILDQIDKDEAALRVRMREWVARQSKSLDDAKSKEIRQAGAARLSADSQRVRQEADARVAAAHTHQGGKDRVGRVATAEAHQAAKDRKAGQRKSGEVTAEAKRQVQNVASESEGQSKELHAFAIAALKDAVPSDLPSLRPAAKGTTRTYLVTYHEGRKNGPVHTDEIMAASPEDAKAKVRTYRPHATIRKVVEK